MGSGAGLIVTAISAENRASRAAFTRWVIMRPQTGQMAASAPKVVVSCV
jgi:hypothetical protein